MSCVKSWGADSVRQMPRMSRCIAMCTSSPPYLSISGKMLQMPSKARVAVEMGGLAESKSVQ